jgi:hypothetical protein
MKIKISRRDRQVGEQLRKLEADKLAKLLSERRFCYVIPHDAFIEGFGYRVSIAIEKESGHWPTGDLRTLEGDYSNGATMPWFWGMTYEEACKACDEQNARLGYTPEEAFKIVASTMGRVR